MDRHHIRYVHRLSEREFAERLNAVYGKESLSVRAFDYVRKRMRAERVYILEESQYGVYFTYRDLYRGLLRSRQRRWLE